MRITLLPIKLKIAVHISGHFYLYHDLRARATKIFAILTALITCPAEATRDYIKTQTWMVKAFSLHPL